MAPAAPIKNFWEEIMAAPYDLNDDSLVVIIGSGAGGGTLGNELAQKGVDVVILEAGARIDPRTSPEFRFEGTAA